MNYLPRRDAGTDLVVDRFPEFRQLAEANGITVVDIQHEPEMIGAPMMGEYIGRFPGYIFIVKFFNISFFRSPLY